MTPVAKLVRDDTAYGRTTIGIVISTAPGAERTTSRIAPGLSAVNS